MPTWPPSAAPGPVGDGASDDSDWGSFDGASDDGASFDGDSASASFDGAGGDGASFDSADELDPWRRDRVG